MQAVPLFDLRDHCASVREAVVARLDVTLDAQRFILGPEVAELEQAFAALVGATHAIGCGCPAPLPPRVRGGPETAHLPRT